MKLKHEALLAVCSILCVVNAAVWRWGAHLIETHRSSSLRDILMGPTRLLSVVLIANVVGLALVAFMRGKLKISDLLCLILAVAGTLAIWSSSFNLVRE